jgi:hypothetical protein
MDDASDVGPVAILRGVGDEIIVSEGRHVARGQTA